MTARTTTEHTALDLTKMKRNAAARKRRADKREIRERELEIIACAAKALGADHDTLNWLRYAVVIVGGEEGGMIVSTGQPSDPVYWLRIGQEGEGWESSHWQSADFSCRGHKAAREINGGGKILAEATVMQIERAIKRALQDG